MVQIVIDEDVLDNLNNGDKPYGILPYWLNQNKTTAAVSELAFNNFIKTKEDQLKDLSDETKRIFFGMIKGQVSRIQDKNGETCSINATKDLINSHYATIKYVIVKDPSHYRSQKLKVSDEFIVTVEGFYKLLEMEESGKEIITKFERRNIYE